MIVRLKDLCKSYIRGGSSFFAVSRVNLEIASGDYVNIIGRSGSGKSTLLNMVAGMLTPSSGSVEINGADLKDKSDGELSFLRNDFMGFIPQGNATLPNLTVLENITLPFHLYKREGDSQGRGQYLLEKFEIASLGDSYPRQLSGGELRRVLIVRALVNNPKILVADEPTSDLDVENSRQIMETFSKINEEGVTLLLVSHDLDTLGYGKKVYTMASGELQEGNLLKASIKKLEDPC